MTAIRMGAFYTRERGQATGAGRVMRGPKMANLLKFFLAPDDEVAFFRFLERFHLEVYPRRVPPDWKPFEAEPKEVERLPEEEMYLAAAHLGNVIVDKVKRGKD